jgi:hypothetical protein
MKFNYNIVIILLLFIIIVVAIELTFTKIIEGKGKRYNYRHYYQKKQKKKSHVYNNNKNQGISGQINQTTQTNYSEWNKEQFTIENFSSNTLPSDINYWPELESVMKPICINYGYTVNQWEQHIHLLANQIQIPVEVRDVNINVWITYRTFSKSDVISENKYNIYHTNKYTPNDVTVISPDTKHQYRFTNYDSFILQLVKTEITNDNQLMQLYNLNRTETFSDISNENEHIFNQLQENQSFLTYLYSSFFPLEAMTLPPDQLLKNADKIKISDEKYVVNNNIIDSIRKTGYQLLSTDSHEFITQFTSNGKTIHDIVKYINALQSIQINDEFTEKDFKQCVYLKLNPKNTDIVGVTTLINAYLPNYGLTSVTDFTKNLEDGDFTVAVIHHKLHALSIPLFPPKNNPSNCVMEKMVLINGINIPTVGKQSENVYNINLFFMEFQSNGISAQQFFDEIYTIYSTLKINSSSYDLRTTLYKYISPLSQNGFVDALKNLKTNLDAMNMQFNDYVLLVDTLNQHVTFNKTDIVTIWNNFVQYYSTVAYNDASNQTLDNPVTVSTLSNWFQNISTSYPSFFTQTSVNFLDFLNILIKNSYTLNSMNRDISLGMTYKKITLQTIPMKNNTTEKFSAMNSFIESDYMKLIDKYIHYFSQYLFGFRGNHYEGMDTTEMIASDAAILTSFGISSFSDGSLKNLEQILIQNNVSDIDPSKTPWENIMIFIFAMIKIQVTNANLQDFITLMKNFNALYITDWLNVLKKLAPYKITGYSDVNTFITQITAFGVRYDSPNFDVFIAKMIDFNADFSGVNKLQPLITFLNDMTTIGATYNTIEGTAYVNNIIDYFVHYKFTLLTYSSKTNLQLTDCASPNMTSFPPHFCSSLVNAMYKYTDTTHFHSFYDIQTQSLFNLIPYCDAFDAMQQAYTLCKGDQSESIIIQNKIIIVSFFYPEEVQAIIANSMTYNNIDKRVKMMHDIASTMKKIAKTFDQSSQKDTILLYNSIANVFTIFPAVSFQYFSNLFISSCSDGKCDTYSLYVDPKYTYAKASMTVKTINMRSIDAVI